MVESDEQTLNGHGVLGLVYGVALEYTTFSIDATTEQQAPDSFSLAQVPKKYMLISL